MAERDTLPPTPHEAGKSSFSLIDFEAFVTALDPSGAKVIADVGCGVGNYSIPLARKLGPGTRIVGFDLWAEGVEKLNETARKEGLDWLSAARAEAGNLAPLSDNSVDILFMATVLHDLAERKDEAEALAEAARVLRPGGTLGVVEFKKIESNPGPPLSIRLSPEEVEALVTPHGFTLRSVTSLGPITYVSTFSAK